MNTLKKDIETEPSVVRGEKKKSTSGQRCARKVVCMRGAACDACLLLYAVHSCSMQTTEYE